MKKFSIITILSVLLLLGNTSCSDYLDVNKNVDAPDYVEGYLYLAGIEAEYYGLYYDVRGTSALTQMFGTTSYTSYANNYYSPGSDSEGELWRMTYWNQGMNLENMINQSIEAKNYTLAGIGLAMKAYSWDQLTKEHGELPMKEAFVAGRLSHDYDYQSEIYPQIRTWATQAIKYLEMTDDTQYGTKITANDYIYGGDKAKWEKFAYGVIVSNLASLSNKKDFVTQYADSLILCASKSFTSADDDAALTIAGGSSDAAYDSYNNFWGTTRENLEYSYFQHDYAVQVMTGTVYDYDETTGNRINNPDDTNKYHPYMLAEKQIICDTLNTTGHYDPRMAVKLSTTDDATYANISNADSVKAYKYYGGSFTGATGPIGTAPSVYGSYDTSYDDKTVGPGRWLFRDDAPYIMMTYAELQFDLAEAYWKKGDKANALVAFKAGVAGDMDFTAKYLTPGSASSPTTIGDKISKTLFSKLSKEYLAGPYVGGMTADDLTLSHIMMQKWVSLYPWGALEAWTDLRKYFYDISFTGDYPTNKNGAWDLTMVNQKWDTDATKVYKGFYLAPAQVQGRKGSYATQNHGSPCFRIRPRYNSEYMWNLPSLQSLKPIAGDAENYQCSIPWFAYPGDMPTEIDN
jgi:hypothetical protein